MNLRHVTITGVTNRAAKLLALSRKYTFVEWGVLFAAGSGRTSRYPDFYTALELVDHLAGSGASVAAHVCGALATDIMENGPFSRALLPMLTELDCRIQVNLPRSNARNTNIDAFKALYNRHPNTKFIFQHNDSTESIVREFADHNNARFLRDASGGTGTEEAWRLPPRLVCDGRLRYGFAGGITASNVMSKLRYLDQLLPAGVATWIDMESGVRTAHGCDDGDDQLDLVAVESVLHQAAEFRGEF